MELCLIGLFFLVRDVDEIGNAVGTPCKGQAIIMIVILMCTIIYQYLLNVSFGPLIRYLPITLEDEAAFRDEEFARAQGKKWNPDLSEEGGNSVDMDFIIEKRAERSAEEERQAKENEKLRMQSCREQGIPEMTISEPSRRKPRMVRRIKRRPWISEPLRPKPNQLESSRSKSSVSESIMPELVAREPRYLSDIVPDVIGKLGPNKGVLAERPSNNQTHNSALPDHEKHQHPSRQKGSDDLEAQRTGKNPIGEALFSGINDQIQDLSPEDRDKLVQRAFQHEALRAKRPVIWIPRDELGVSDDEIFRTQRFSKHIWITNDYTGLDAKGRVVYRRSPPDFSEVDLIEL